MVVKKNILFALLFLVFSLSFISAVNVEIIKSSVDEINLGETVIINLNIKNNQESLADIYVMENIFDAEAVNPSQFKGGVVDNMIAFSPYYYDWELNIPAESKKEVSYEIKPSIPGEFLIGPTKAYINGDIFYSNEISILVACNKNNVCEDNLFENFKNCPEDCSKSQRDDICNLDDDGICDPDCEAGADLDCVAGFEGIENGDKKSSGFSFSFLDKIDWNVFGIVILVLMVIAGIPVSLYYDKKRESKSGNKKVKKKTVKKGSSFFSLFSSKSTLKKKEKKSTVKYCGKCGKTLHKSDRFCKKCGKKA